MSSPLTSAGIQFLLFRRKCPLSNDDVFTYNQWAEFLSCECWRCCTCWSLSGRYWPDLVFGLRKCLLSYGSGTSQMFTLTVTAPEVLCKRSERAALRLEGGAQRLFGSGAYTAVTLSRTLSLCVLWLRDLAGRICWGWGAGWSFS